MPQNIAVKIELSDQFLSDVISVAIDSGYQGIGYWARVKSYDGKQIVLKPNEPAFPDDDPREKYQVIDQVRLALAILKIVQGIVKVRSDIQQAVYKGALSNDAGNIDADAADVIIQVAAFGEIVFG